MVAVFSGCSLAVLFLVFAFLVGGMLLDFSVTSSCDVPGVSDRGPGVEDVEPVLEMAVDEAVVSDRGLFLADVEAEDEYPAETVRGADGACALSIDCLGRAVLYFQVSNTAYEGPRAMLRGRRSTGSRCVRDLPRVAIDESCLYRRWRGSPLYSCPHPNIRYGVLYASSCDAPALHSLPASASC